MKNRIIQVSEPLISKKAKQLVHDCLNTGWISSHGTYINEFEKEFAAYLGLPYAVSTNNGTCALHLALASLRIGLGDEVIIPDLTIISDAFAAIYVGATPVFVDVEPQSGNINPDLIEEKITKKTKAIVVVHLYGRAAEMDKIMKLAKKHNLYVIEDAAEAIGVSYRGKKTGTFGDVSIYSFYANKIVTTGEGGMVVTQNKKIFERVKLLKNMAHRPHARFHHDELGFNYQMTNIQAALGLAHLNMLNQNIKRKKHIASLYTRLLAPVTQVTIPAGLFPEEDVCWMFDIQVPTKHDKEELMEYLKNHNIETRTYFLPLHQQIALSRYKSTKESYPVSVNLYERGLYLPSGLPITDKEISIVGGHIRSFFDNK